MFDHRKRPWEPDDCIYREWLSPTNPGDDSEALTDQRRAVREVLTSTQWQYAAAYYAEGLTVTQISERVGVTKATVSRTLKRAQKRLEFVRLCKLQDRTAKNKEGDWKQCRR